MKFVVTYDGRDFAGWQSQRHGNTIQDQLEIAFGKICRWRVSVIGAGRTDAGVHALGQCAHADLDPGRLSIERWITALNGTLPATIRILRARFVSPNFHARFSAKGKVYRYRIVNGAVISPFELGRAWHVAAPLDRALLKRAAKLFVGRHDFSNFAAKRGKFSENATRTINSLRVTIRGNLIELEFAASGFLYKMVRLITGTIVRCALGKETLDSIKLRLEKPEPNAARFVAPAPGLYLVRVSY
jgi:tRNA pseudouridine38-40 synthase